MNDKEIPSETARTRVMCDRFFNECIVRDECAKLRSILNAIEKWEDVAAADWNDSEPDTSEMNDLQAEWAENYFNDQAFMMHQTKLAMLSSLSVTIAASIENFLGALCDDLDLTDDLGDRPNWGSKRPAIEKRLEISFGDLGRYRDVNRVRLLANCFKHNESKLTDDFVKSFGGTVNDEINYEKENWGGFIEATQAFLMAIVEET